MQDRPKLMLWKVASGALKTRGLLGRIFHQENEEAFKCLMCQQDLEESLHLLVYCPIACTAW